MIIKWKEKHFIFMLGYLGLHLSGKQPSQSLDVPWLVFNCYFCNKDRKPEAKKQQHKIHLWFTSSSTLVLGIFVGRLLNISKQSCWLVEAMYLEQRLAVFNMGSTWAKSSSFMLGFLSKYQGHIITIEQV